MISRKKPRSSACVTSSFSSTPSMMGGFATFGLASSVLVRAVLTHVVVDLVVGLDRLAGVTPEALDDVVLHPGLADVVVVHVGDLELTPSRRLQGRDDLEDVGRVEVDAGDAVRARGVRRLLDDLRHPSVAIQLGDAEVLQ